MHLTFLNAESAFESLVGGIAAGRGDLRNLKYTPIFTETNESRNGRVYVVPEPVTVTYLNPVQRVILNPVRDCNPFFHVFESLWMLAGRNDLAPLTRYITDFGKFSDDGRTLNGAYGYRWREALNMVDQLFVIAKNLKENPHCRRQVLTMWTVQDDLCKVNTSKDVCCNTQAYFLVKTVTTEGHVLGSNFTTTDKYLDMTVTNRSNDLVLGMLGANVVHFSFLQEYMAARIGVNVGKYHQFTNNLHVYDWNWKPKEWLSVYGPRDMHSSPEVDPYLSSYHTRVPLVYDADRFDREVVQFIDHPEDGYSEPFLVQVAAPMMTAHRLYKEGKYDEAQYVSGNIVADDWRIASQLWLQRRIAKKEGNVK